MMYVHPFDREKEFPNYFEIMLNSVPEELRKDFVDKIQVLIEENISTLIKRLKLYYVNDDLALFPRTPYLINLMLQIGVLYGYQVKEIRQRI